MPWKLIAFLILLVLVAVFAALNLDNRSDISLGFYVFEKVPVFLALLLSFLLGALLMIPFTVGPSARRWKAQKEKKRAQEEKKKAQEEKKLEKEKQKRKKAKKAAPEAVVEATEEAEGSVETQS